MSQPAMRSLLIALVVGCTPPAPPPAPEPEPEPELPVAPVWPEAGAPLTVLEPTFPEDYGIKRIYLDAGHGAKGNIGNVGAYCQWEQDFTRRVTARLATDLRETGHFDIRQSRTGDQQTDYKARVRGAGSFRADAFVSIHSDVRGPIETWTPRPERECNVNHGYDGFSVLWSDEGDDPLKGHRQRLSDALSNRMGEAGFKPYDGVEYESLYAGDPDVPGSFVDRHAPARRIMVLRRPTMPSVIIETHQALDPDEVARWGEERTLRAFSAAVVAGLVDALGNENP